MSRKYETFVQKVLKGNLEETSLEIRGKRDLMQISQDEELERKLISFRLALKAGNLEEPLSNLDESRTSSDFLKGEVFFVKGSYHAQLSDHKRASHEFARAVEAYRAAKHFEKQALSLFNNLIARTYAEILTAEQEMQELDQIIAFCLDHQISQTEFLCHRHRSFRHFEKKEFKEAIDSIILWVGRRDALTKSDSELALLHVADCYFEIGDLRNALFYFDQIPASVDERVRFPKAFVEAKIFRKKIDLQAFPLISSHWKNRYLHSDLNSSVQPSPGEKVGGLLWDFKTGWILKSKRKKAQVKSQSLEGQLLRLLSDEPRTKAQICETIWPSSFETNFLDDRFHQLVQRINRKMKDFIVFDGQRYRLSQKLHQRIS